MGGGRRSMSDERSILLNKTSTLPSSASSFVTKIHGRHYDLSAFQHPGGQVAISLVYGRDATEMFESYHQFADVAKVHAMLAKYEVKGDPETPIASNDVYDWQETNASEFTVELQNLANQVLSAPYVPSSSSSSSSPPPPPSSAPSSSSSSAPSSSSSSAPSSSSLASTTTAPSPSPLKDADRIARTKISPQKIIELMSFLVLAVTQYYYLVRGAYFSIFTFPTALWLFTVNVFHDGSHFAVSKYPFINNIMTETALLFSTPFTWYHQHIIGHHCFPNIMGKDPDLYHSVKFIRHSRDIRHKPPHANQAFIFPLLWVIGVPLGLILRGCLDSLAGKPYNKVVPLIPDEAAHIISRKSVLPRLGAIVVTMFVLPVCYHGMTWKGLAFAVFPYLVYSCHFMVCSQINHFTPESDDQVSKNFYIQQVLTGHNVAPESYLLYLYTGGLNMQIEHHLFPSVNHCHLRKLAPYVRALCAKHNIHYNVSPGMFTAVQRYVDHLRKFAVSSVP